MFAERGVPQPRVRRAAQAERAARGARDDRACPAVLKPADSGGQRGIFRLDSLDDLEAHLHAALAESRSGEAIVESFHDGLELNGLAVARDGEVELLTLSDRLRPPGIGFGVGWAHLYPSTLFGDALEHAEETVVAAIHALGLRDGIAFPQVIVSPRRRVPRRRGRGADPRRPDGRPRAPRRRRRPRRGRAAAGARRRGSRRARASRASRSRSRSSS